MVDKCPFCASSFRKVFCNDGRFLKCDHCEMVCLDKKLWATEVMPDYYINAQNYISVIDDDDKIKLAIRRADYLIKKINKFFNGRENIKWLDVGANYGILVERLVKHGYDAEGLELNLELVKNAQARGVPLHCADVTDLSQEKPNGYDVISAIDVLEHLSEPIKFFENVKRLIKPGGLFIVEVPNIDSYLGKHHGNQWKYVDREHLHYFTPKTLEKILVKFDFSVENMYYTNPFLEVFSISKLFHYFYPRPVSGDRLSQPLKAGLIKKQIIPKKQHFSMIRSLFKKILIFFIHILNREDFILIIAKKKSDLY